MVPTPIDRYFAAKCVKSEVDKAYKEAEAEAAIYLDEARDEGKTSLISTYFGEEAGEYKRGKTRAKKIVEYNLAYPPLLEDWVNDNTYTVFLYLKERVADFGAWCVDTNGEVPEGISRVEHDEPPHLKAPSIYRFDHELVKAKLAQGGNLLDGANRLLLSDGNE